MASIYQLFQSHFMSSYKFHSNDVKYFFNNLPIPLTGNIVNDIKNAEIIIEEDVKYFLESGSVFISPPSSSFIVVPPNNGSGSLN